MRRISTFMAAAALALSSTAAMAAGPPDDAGSQGQQVDVIVVLEAGNPADVAADHGVDLSFLYEDALLGFAGSVPEGRLNGLRNDRRVDYVEFDRLVTLSAQEVPTGIARILPTGDPANLGINGADDKRVAVGVAVIDTGIDFEHPDLNVVDGVNCASGGPFGGGCAPGGDDDHYHGTHVAGTIAALDNGVGVVGVAPGADLYAVKVLSKRGSGYTSWIVAGINWVAANADRIQVANMSLGGSGFSQAEYDAIQGAVNAGVAFAVAAGNDAENASGYSPAAFDNVLTVSALADFDGQAGGLADGRSNRTCLRSDDVDDTLAYFSNFGSAVDIAAPGTCILSTYPIEQGSYNTISGTSMASPHAAGALALLASNNDPTNAADVFALYDAVKAAGNDDWSDDSGDGIPEPLLDVSGMTPRFTDDTGGGGGGGGEDPNATPDAAFTSSCTLLDCDFDATSSSDSDGTIVSWDWDFGDGATASGQTSSHTFANGTWSVRLTVTDDGGATDSITHQVTVSDGSEPEAPTATISYDRFGGRNGKHLGINVTLSGDGVGGASVSIALSRNGQVIGTAAGTADANGFIRYELKNAGPGCYTTDVTEVVINGSAFDPVETDPGDGC